MTVTAVWGSTFVLIKDAVATMPVADFLTLRFGIATLVLVVLFGRRAAALPRPLVLRGIALGLLYGGGQLLQTWGLDRTSAAVAGFVTGLYVVLTPVLAALLLRRRSGPTTWAAVTLATAGLGLLSLHGLSVGPGELLVLASTVLYALHVVGLGQWSTSGDALGLTVWQLGTITVVCALTSAPGGWRLPTSTATWGAVLYTAVVAGAVTMLLQTWAQARMSATRAAIVMTMEPVFAAVFAVLLGREGLTWRSLTGGTLVVLAMLLVELRPDQAPTAAVATDPEAAHHLG